MIGCPEFSRMRRPKIAALGATYALGEHRCAAPQAARFAAISASGILFFFSACTSVSAPTPYGTDNFVMNATTSQGGYSTPFQVQKAAFEEANNHCAGLGKAMQPLSQTSTGAGGWSQGVALSLLYRCLPTVTR